MLSGRELPTREDRFEISPPISSSIVWLSSSQSVKEVSFRQISSTSQNAFADDLAAAYQAKEGGNGTIDYLMYTSLFDRIVDIFVVHFILSTAPITTMTRQMRFELLLPYRSQSSDVGWCKRRRDARCLALMPYISC